MITADPVLYLLDTNVISEATKRKPEPKVIDFLIKLTSTHLSVITLAEIQSGISQSPDQSGRLRKWLISVQEACTLHDVTKDVAILAGRWQGELKADGHTRAFQDIVIGATAHHHNMTLLTRNIEDFNEMQSKGLSVRNPWDLDICGVPVGLSAGI